MLLEKLPQGLRESCPSQYQCRDQQWDPRRRRRGGEEHWDQKEDPRFLYWSIAIVSTSQTRVRQGNRDLRDPAGQNIFMDTKIDWMFYFTCIAAMKTSGRKYHCLCSRLRNNSALWKECECCQYNNSIATIVTGKKWQSLLSHEIPPTPHMVSGGLLCWMVVTKPTAAYPSIPAFLSNTQPGEKPWQPPRVREEEKINFSAKGNIVLRNYHDKLRRIVQKKCRTTSLGLPTQFVFYKLFQKVAILTCPILVSKCLVVCLLRLI